MPDEVADDLPDEGPTPGDDSPDVMAHLQAAALELIAAARAVLDAAEHTVRDPAGAVDLMSLLSGLARSGRGRARGEGDSGTDDGDGGNGLERIPVS